MFWFVLSFVHSTFTVRLPHFSIPSSLCPSSFPMCRCTSMNHHPPSILARIVCRSCIKIWLCARVDVYAVLSICRSAADMFLKWTSGEGEDRADGKKNNQQQQMEWRKCSYALSLPAGYAWVKGEENFNRNGYDSHNNNKKKLNSNLWAQN